MPALATPVKWHPPSAAYAALRPLLDSGGGLVDVVVRLAPGNPHYPLKGPRYRMALYRAIRETGVFIDVTSRRTLFNISGWVLT
ncbi:hypothetical protein [Paraburkholderia sediminicola]|uniref:hypothetical protein n=1 Tax=Paraburkholderia sediminicola TaxID=458836 RepID=UPI0038BB18BB